MENKDTFFFSLLTIAAIDTVVWTVVPLAGKHIQAFWNRPKKKIIVIIIFNTIIQYKFIAFLI